MKNLKDNNAYLVRNSSNKALGCIIYVNAMQFTTLMEKMVSRDLIRLYDDVDVSIKRHFHENKYKDGPMPIQFYYWDAEVYGGQPKTDAVTIERIKIFT